MKVTYVKPEVPRKPVFGLDFIDLRDELPLVEEFIDLAENGESATVVTPNVDIMIQISENPESVSSQLARSADYCTPDGQPLVWASKLLGHSLSSRISGSSLFAELWPRVKLHQMPVAMVCSSEAVADFYTSDYDNISIEVPPYVDSSNHIAMDALLVSTLKRASLNDSRMIFLGLGYQKDTILAAGIKKRWTEYSTQPAPLVLCLGASFEMHAGLKRRAPRWMQKAGLEWFFRFLQEPKRLFRRYFVDSPRFLKVMWSEFRSN